MRRKFSFGEASNKMMTVVLIGGGVGVLFVVLIAVVLMLIKPPVQQIPVQQMPVQQMPVQQTPVQKTVPLSPVPVTEIPSSNRSPASVPSQKKLEYVMDGFLKWPKATSTGSPGLQYASPPKVLFGNVTGLSPIKVPPSMNDLNKLAEAVPGYVAKVLPEYVGKYNIISVWGDGGFRLFYASGDKQTLVSSLTKDSVKQAVLQNATFIYM